MNYLRTNLLIAGLLFANLCFAVTTKDKSKPEKAEAKGNKNMVVMETSLGTIKIKLESEKAPVSVENFLKYVDEGFYNGTIFHRVISNFMIQGGGFSTDKKQKKTHAPIKIESNNGLKNTRGTLAMARTSDPNSATAQFFINVKDNDFLNFSAPTMSGYGYAVFGEVVEGMDIVDAIRNVKTVNNMEFQDFPEKTVEIKSITRAK